MSTFFVLNVLKIGLGGLWGVNYLTFQKQITMGFQLVMSKLTDSVKKKTKFMIYKPAGWENMVIFSSKYDQRIQNQYIWSFHPLVSIFGKLKKWDNLMQIFGNFSMERRLPFKMFQKINILCTHSRFQKNRVVKIFNICALIGVFWKNKKCIAMITDYLSKTVIIIFFRMKLIHNICYIIDIYIGNISSFQLPFYYNPNILKTYFNSIKTDICVSSATTIINKWMYCCISERLLINGFE